MSNRRTASVSLSSDVLAWLLKRGLNQAEIARMLGVSQGYISLVKSRERALTLDHLTAIADALQLPLGAMLLQVGERPKKMSAESTALFEVTERLIRKADEANAAVRAQLAGSAGKRV